jgi:diacylglycerol O-acyltransferase / wax synthase
MERLSGLDSAFLSFETPSMHLHVAMLAVVDTSTMPEPYRFDRLKDFVVARLRVMPAARRRAVDVPFRLNHPLWVEDPNVDLDYHIRRHALPDPGGAAELADLIGHLAGMPLDRNRPLWEIHVIEGLQGGHVALFGKMHHAAVDGVSGAELFVHLFDLTPAPQPAPEPPEVPVERIPSDIEMVSHAVMSQVRRTIGLPALIGRTARTATALVSRHRDAEAATGAVPLKAPKVPWTAAITPHRSAAFARVSLDDVKAVKNAFGVKVNDIVLSLTTIALRRWLDERGALPKSPLVALVPMSVRTEDQRGRFNNQVSPMWVKLRTDVAEPAKMVKATARGSQGAKEDQHHIGAALLMDWTEHAAPSTFALAARVYSRLNLADRHRPIYNLVVSNVPGPTFPLYLHGAELVAAYPMGPVSEGAGLNVTVMSYRDHLDIGLLAGKELVPGLDAMAGYFEDAMVDLLEAAGLSRSSAHTQPDPDVEPEARVAAARAGTNGSSTAPVPASGEAQVATSDQALASANGATAASTSSSAASPATSPAPEPTTPTAPTAADGADAAARTTSARKARTSAKPRKAGEATKAPRAAKAAKSSKATKAAQSTTAAKATTATGATKAAKVAKAAKAGNAAKKSRPRPAPTTGPSAPA